MSVSASVQTPLTFYLSLLRSQLRHELQMKYLGSLAGVYWAVINPVLQVALYVFLVQFVFRASLGMSGGPMDYALFVLAGMSPWLAIQEGMLSSANSIVRNASIVKNLVFPLELLPLSAALTSLVSLAISLSALMVLALFRGAPLGPSLVCLPLLVLLQITLTVGIGFFVATMVTFLRDVAQILPVLLQLVMLATPVLYTIEQMPSSLRQLTWLNPFYYLIDGYRAVFIGGTWPSGLGLLYVGLLGACLVFVGVRFFRRAKGLFEAVV